MKSFLNKLYISFYKLFHKEKIYQVCRAKSDKKYCAGCYRNMENCPYFKDAIVVIKDIYIKSKLYKIKTLNCFISKR